MKTEPLAERPSRKERRHEQRRKYDGKIEIEWGSATLPGVVRDIGPRGMFIELTPPLWLGARFFARLALHPPVRLDCTVSRIEPGSGIAVMFTISEESGKAQFSALLAALPAK